MPRAMNEPSSDPRVHELDVRPLLAAGQGPIGAILQAVHALPAGGALRLIAPFEPVPLYAKLGDAGFDHAVRVRDDGAYEVTFSPREPRRPDPILLDLRGLEPPQPMMRVLEELEVLPAGGVILAQTRFRPIHLLEILAQRGFVGDSAEQPDGSWETVITASEEADGGPLENPDQP